MAAYQGLRVVWTACFLGRCRPLADPQALALWHEVCTGSPLRDRTRLLTSAAVRAPCCWGLLRPCVVFPADWRDAPADALQWALRHERVHLERRDSWAALAQALLLTLYWYHPFAWWLSRHLDWWREVSCDLGVVRRVGQRQSYALALSHFAGPAARDRRPALFHAADAYSRLCERVHMLAIVDHPPARRRRRLGWAAAALLGLVGVAQLGASAAFQRAAAPPTDLQGFVEVEEFFSDGRRQVWHKVVRPVTP
jgi:beta-lactamase regulating signal transducer with metallopeptidase domain